MTADPLPLTELLDQLESLLDGATPGRWVCGWAFQSCKADHGPNHHRPGYDESICKYETIWITDEEGGTGPHAISTADGEVCIAGNYDYEDGGIVSPADVPVIVAAVNLLRPMVEALRAAAMLMVDLELYAEDAKRNGAGADPESLFIEETVLQHDAQPFYARLAALRDAAALELEEKNRG